MAQSVPLLLRHQGRSHIHGPRGTPLIRRQASGRKLTNHSLQTHSHHLGKTHLTLPRNPLGSAGGFGFGGDGAFAPEAWVVCGETTLPCFFDSHGFASFAGLLQNGRGLPLLQRIFFVASCLRVSPWLTRISVRRGRIPSIPKIPSSASRRLCGRIWVGGRTAHSRLKLGSPRRGDPTHFSIRVDSSFAGCLKRQRTAISTTDFFRGFVPSCEFLAYSYLSAAWQNPEYSQNSLLRVSAPLREDLGWGEDGAFAPETWVPSASRPYLVFSIRADSRHSRGLLQNGRGLPFLQRIFFVASCLRVSPWLTRISARRGRILSIPKIPSSASRRLCGRTWVGGRTARSRLRLGSPRRGDPTHFSIRAHLLAFAGLLQNGRGLPLLQQN
jgi:hypothetical protein